MTNIRPGTSPAVQRGPSRGTPQRRAHRAWRQPAVRCKQIIAALILLTAAGMAQATCWAEASREFSIAPELLYAIAEQESGLNPSAIGYNNNGTRDIGLMQINTSHLPWLAKQQITEKTLLNNSCQSLKVGAGILAGFMRRFGYSWKAVGAYNAGGADNSGAQQRRMDYAKKIAVRYRRVLNEAKKGAAKTARGVAIPSFKLAPPAAQLDRPKLF
ncbi:MAG: iagB [Herbaspirillum sp.]|nr:iagB [Herbaspirillum sp.]